MAASDTWVRLTDEPLAVGALADWAVRPDCGAVVLFTGTVRDHAEGRPGVSRLEYEAYGEHVEPRLGAIAAEARRRWPAARPTGPRPSPPPGSPSTPSRPPFPSGSGRRGRAGRGGASTPTTWPTSRERLARVGALCVR